MKDVMLIMGSDSDLPIVEECAKILDGFKISYQMRVLSAHRTPEEAKAAIEEADAGGTKVFIAFAGLAAHLPGVVASHTAKPVIGVPVAGGPLNGADAMLSILQMPSGVPVATMAIGKAGAKNAAVFAAQVISTASEEMAKALKIYKDEMRKGVLEKDKKVNSSK